MLGGWETRAYATDWSLVLIPQWMSMRGSPRIGTISSLVRSADERGNVFLIARQILMASIWHPFAAVLVSAWFSWALHPANDKVIDSESVATARNLTFMAF
jgi:hypothetical protein